MKLLAKISVCLVLAMLFLSCCTYQRKAVLKPADLPEEIYISPEYNTYLTSKVGIFSFASPLYAPEMGKIAAQYLYREVLKANLFIDVTLEQDAGYIKSIDNLIDIACGKMYDLIIIGDLSFYFDGSHFEASRIKEQILVLKLENKMPEILWYAETRETAFPAPSTDLILIYGLAAPAPSTAELMEKNAEKFCKMLLYLPPR